LSSAALVVRPDVADDDGMTKDEPRLLVRQAEGRRRYELLLGRERVGFIQYRDEGEVRIFLHTEIEPDYEGHGLATQLIEWALNDARSLGKKVRPDCPTVAAYFAKHPELDDLVD
jgi:predicted GNAT family acetyltransferase